MRLKEADIIRFFAILSIVFYHCVLCPICIWEPSLIEQNSRTEFVKIATNILMPEANMLLFIFLSGYVFGYSIISRPGAYDSFWTFLMKKKHRLLVPFIILGTLANLMVPERPLNGIIWGAGSSLWFCIVLFWLFLIRWCALHCNMTIRVVIILLCFFYVFNAC